MLQTLRYVVNIIRLYLIMFRKKTSTRISAGSPHGDLADHEACGLLATKSDWFYSTPNLDRKENVSIFASDAHNKMACSLQLKWRPNSELQSTTLLSRLSLDIGEDGYDYVDTATYCPRKSSIHPNYITQYGSRGSLLKFFILNPYRQFRIVFRGYMQPRTPADNKLVYVKLNLLVFVTSNVYDFKSEFDVKSVAQQVSTKRPKGGLNSAMSNLILHDRHEHLVHLTGEYSIHQQTNKIYLWGFHVRQFVEESTQLMRSKRILCHLENGRAFHLAFCENIKNKFSPSEQFEMGYACVGIGPAVYPLTSIRSNEHVNWEEIKSDTMAVKFDFDVKQRSFKVQGKKQKLSSPWFSLTCHEPKGALDLPTPGWGLILINDSLDSNEELQEVELSRREYQRKLREKDIISSSLLEGKLPKEVVEKKPLLVNLEDENCVSALLVGAKAASLAQLHNRSSSVVSNNYKVPKAIVLTKFAYDLLQDENPKLVDEVRRFCAQIGQGHLENLEADCEHLQKMLQVNEIRFPQVLREQLQEQLKNHLTTSGEHLFAVRSSSWGEDEDDMSAAGQLETILSVKGTIESLIEAILRCFSSKFNRTNVEYKRMHGLPLDLPMAVVVQEMVACRKAGVLFTCDPASGDPNRVTITANFGLGESVVSGRTDPDSIRVQVSENKSSEEIFDIVEVKVGEKGVVVDGSEQDDKSKCCLEDLEILNLARCGRQLMNYFQCPQDIEWGYDNQGQLYLFQSRPVTGLDSYTSFELQHEGDMPSRAQKEFVSRVNVGEVFPFAGTPIALSYSIKNMMIMSKRLYQRLRLNTPEDYNLFCSCEGLARSYHFFFCLRSSSLINFVRQSNGERLLIAKAFEVGMFGHEVNDEELEEKATEMSGSDPARFREFWFNWITWKLRHFPMKIITKSKLRMKRLRRDIQSLRYVGKQGASPEGLYRQIRVLFRANQLVFSYHYQASMLSSKFNYELLLLLSNYEKNPTKLYAHLSKFLALSKDVLSAEIPHRIQKMAELIKDRGPKDMTRFVEMSSREALKFVSGDLKSELSKEFDTFMVKFGHRTYAEFEIASTPWRETPELIMDMLQSNVRKYLQKEPMGENNNNCGKSKKQTRSVNEVIESLGLNFSLVDKLKLKYLIVPRCLEFVSIRERTKDLLIESVDIMRDATGLLAKALRQCNRIPDEQLFYYFFYHELGALTAEPQPSLVVLANQRRRLFNNEFKQPWKFDEIIKHHDPQPLHLTYTEEVEEMLKKAPKLVGTTVSSGRVRGKVCLIEDYNQLKRVEANDILVTHSTDIAFSPVFPLIGGIITEVGGIISHGAVVAREYGLPSVIGVKGVTKILQHGEEIVLDADNGVIMRLGEQESQ